MRIFDNGNWGTDTCLVCNSKKKGKVVLLGIDGTEKGHNMQAKQVHLDCLELFYYPQHKLIAQKVK